MVLLYTYQSHFARWCCIVSVSVRLMLAAGLLCVSGIANAKLTIATEHMPPKSMLVNGTVTGYGAERVKEIMRRAKVEYNLLILPWARAYVMALEQPDTCVFSAARTPDRESYFKWIAVTIETDYSLYALRERNLKVTSLDEVSELVIGTYIGDSRAEYLESRGFNVVKIGSHEMNAQMLLKKRVDLWVTNRSSADFMLRREQLSEQIAHVLTFKQEKLYLACHPSLSERLQQAMQRAAQSMREDGTFFSIKQTMLDSALLHRSTP